MCVKNNVNKKNKTSFKKQYNEYDLTGECGVGYCHNTGTQFYFDKEDYEKIKDYCWYEHKNGTYTRLQALDVNTKTVITMSHLLGFKYYDHIDRNPLNNCKNNFRKATRSQQCQNRNTFSNSSTGIIGVSWYSLKNKWVARIQIDKTRKCLGYFYDKRDAIVARLQAEKKYFGEFAPQKHLFDEYGIN